MSMKTSMDPKIVANMQELEACFFFCVCTIVNLIGTSRLYSSTLAGVCTPSVLHDHVELRKIEPRPAHIAEQLIKISDMP